MGILSTQRVLVIAAHPDDEVLGAGGTLARLRTAGKNVRVVFLGEGSTSRYSAQDMNGAEAQHAIKVRSQNALAALEVLNISDVSFLETQCGRFDTLPLLELGKIIECEIAQFEPETIFTHSHVDTNNDHRITFQAVLQATRPGAKNKVANVYSFEIPSSTEWRFVEVFQPNVFVNIENQFEQKILSLSKYESELRSFPFPRSREGLQALAQYRGMQGGLKFAEAFHCVRSIVH